MSVNRLRQILVSALTVGIDSSMIAIEKIENQITKRQQELAAKNKPPIPTKQPRVVNSLQQVDELTVRPVDLLRKIGDLTTPSSMNMARFSASWATRRYFWAVEPGNGPFRLSADARQLDFHQKTLLSDEFGIGMAGLIMERLFQTTGFADMSAALADPAIGAVQEGDPQPDYLMWRSDPQSPYFVVECKGSQSNRYETMNQLRRGMEQVPTIRFMNGDREVISLVIATMMERASTTVFVIDPPDDDTVERKFKGDKVSERVSPREWKIADEGILRQRSWNLNRSHLLKWAGQVRAAADIVERIEE